MATNGSPENPLGNASLSEVAERVGETAGRASELGRKASAAFDDTRKSAARLLDSAAGSIASKTYEAADVALSAAGQIQDTADYVRNADLRELGGEVTGLVKRHPIWAIVVTLGLGFVIGRSLGRA